MYLATFNARIMACKSYLAELKEELSRIKWDIVEYAETRRKDEACLQLKSGQTLFYRGNDKSTHGNAIEYILTNFAGAKSCIL